MREICDKYLPKETIINKNWRKTILDNDIAPTFYKLRRLVWEGVLISTFSLLPTESRVFSIDITYWKEIHSSVCMSPNQ